MSMRTRWKKSAPFRSMALMATSVVALSYPTASWAQNSDEAVLSILRECAKIKDSLARLNCYDNNIRPNRSTKRSQATPDEGREALGGGAPAAGNFGAESVKSADRFKSYSETGQGADEIRTRILEVRQREPGVYLVTIEDGAQWLFAESVPMSFRPPRKGALVSIERASLGSFLMVVDGQAAVRVRRLK
jgi:hypothetical protein